MRLTVIDKKCFPELQEQYCANKEAGACSCYNVGDVFEFYRADGPKIPHCSELWDAISRYIYTGLQGRPIMRGWMEKENEMIACCSDGTRPVIFKIERIDYE